MHGVCAGSVRRMGVHKAALHLINDLPRAAAFDQGSRQSADRKDLIGPKRTVELSGLLIDIDDVVKITAPVGSKSVGGNFPCRA